jgi:hypothetical protein
MKKIILAVALTVSSLAFYNTTQAQISLSINIGSQPDWGPVGYDHVENYYMPDIDTYYSVPTRQYIYEDNGRWIRSASLPSRYRNYDVYNGYKVVVNEANPWNRATTYRTKYAGYKGKHNQTIIRDSRDAKYLNRGQSKKVIVVKHDDRGYDNGRGNNNGRGNDKHDNGHVNNGKGHGHGH